MSNLKPQMSVILTTPDHYQTIRKTIGYLHRQTVKDQLEIVIIAPSKEFLELDESTLKDFGQFQVVEVGPINSVAFANAEGVRHAQAPIVAFGESHAYPEPDWAEKLIDAHRQNWIAVGPAMINENPESAVSWASFLLTYSRWMEPISAGTVDDLPGHNSSYQRSVILEKYGDQLETLLETETVLHWNLKEAGYQLYLEPKAKTHHLNPTRLTSFMGELFYYGRLFAAERSRSWSIGRRLIYIVSSPLIPLIRLKQVLPEFMRAKQHYSLPPLILPFLSLGLIASAAGEALGYALGSGLAMEQLKEFEFHREQHLTEKDRQALIERELMTEKV